MDSRKIQQVGDRSFAVSLPKQWITSNHLKKHDSVFMRITNNNEVLIRKVNVEKKSTKNIELYVESTENLLEFIVFCYVKNINQIKLRSKSIDHNISRIVREAIKYLEGYEITNEDEKSVEITFLFNEINITLPQIIRRMYYLLKLHISAIENQDSKVLEETELSVDRLYHLSTRIIFSCMQDYSLRHENEINNEEELFYVQIISKRMESISDNLLKLKNKKLQKTDYEQFNKLMTFLSNLISNKAQPSKLKSELESIKIYSKDRQTEVVLHRIYDLSKDIFEAKISIEFNERMEREQNKI